MRVAELELLPTPGARTSPSPAGRATSSTICLPADRLVWPAQRLRHRPPHRKARRRKHHPRALFARRRGGLLCAASCRLASSTQLIFAGLQMVGCNSPATSFADRRFGRRLLDDLRQ